MEKSNEKKGKLKLIILYIVISALALAVRIREFNFVSGDMRYFLVYWYSFLQHNGGLFAIKDLVTDYEPLYLTIIALLTYIKAYPVYLIKTVSVIGDFLLAFACVRLVKILLKDTNKNVNLYGIVTYAIILFLPTVVLNSSKWGQCDALYTAFIILAFGDLYEKKYNRMFVFLGIAFAFKLQTILILPLFITVYFAKKEYHWYQFLIIPAMLVICAVPAICFGMPFKYIFTGFFIHTAKYNEFLSCNFFNIYNFISTKNIDIINIIIKVGVLVALIVDFIIFIFTLKYKEKLNNENILFLGIIYMILETFFLPEMHDRYLFVGEMLAIIYAITYRKNYLLAVYLNAQSLWLYYCFLYNAFYFFTYEFYFNLSFPCLFAIVITYYTDQYLLQMKDESEKKKLKKFNFFKKEKAIN